MQKEQCNKCSQQSNIDHYIYCKKCLQSLKVCSKTNAKTMFLLKDGDLAGLKNIYLEGSNHVFYKYDDVEKLIVNKYGSTDNLKDIIAKRKEEYEARNVKKNKLKEERKQILKEAFLFNKLEFKNHGDCYSFVNYGKPSLDVVVNNEIMRVMERENRIKSLDAKLREKGLIYDETIGACYEYINCIGDRTLDETVKVIYIEANSLRSTNRFALCFN